MGISKNMISVLFAALCVFMFAASVSALDVTIDEVEINEDTIYPTGTNSIRDLFRGEDFEVKVHFTANGAPDVVWEDVQVEVTLSGIHNDDVSDTTDTFDAKAGRTYVKELNLDFPQRMDQDVYRLRVRVEDRDGDTIQQDYTLDVDTERNLLTIKDVVLSPAGSVQAGRALLATVRVKNYGEETEDDVKVTVSIPELGISATDYIEELEGDAEEESSSTEELYLRIPACAEAKSYLMDVEVVYDDGDESTSTTQSVVVTEGDYCPSGAVPSEGTAMTVVTVGTTAQNVVRGEGGAIYPVTITNQGQTTGTYTVDVDLVGNWASVQLSPSNVVTVPAGATTTVYVYVSATSTAAVGENMFSVTVSKGGDVLQQVPMTSNVVEKSSSVGTSGWSGLKKALEIALVVLVVLLVLIGLIVGFNKLRGAEDEDEDESEKTYY